jgi:hypothetical protein
VCVCVYETSVLTRALESRKKFGRLKLFLQKKSSDKILIIWSELPGYHESTSMYKTFLQGL